MERKCKNIGWKLDIFYPFLLLWLHFSPPPHTPSSESKLLAIFRGCLGTFKVIIILVKGILRHSWVYQNMQQWQSQAAWHVLFTMYEYLHRKNSSSAALVKNFINKCPSSDWDNQRTRQYHPVNTGAPLLGSPSPKLTSQRAKLSHNDFFHELFGIVSFSCSIPVSLALL